MIFLRRRTYPARLAERNPLVRNALRFARLDVPGRDGSALDAPPVQAQTAAVRRVLLSWVLSAGLACGGGDLGSTDVDAAVDASTGDGAREDAWIGPDAGDAPDGVVGDAPATDAPAIDAPAADAPAPSCPALAACPATPAVTEGGGPKPIERCAFVLKDDGKGPAYEAAIAGLGAALKKVSLTDVLADLNRTATSVGSTTVGATGFSRGFAWDADDEGKAWWIPQGLSGSFDASAAGTVAGKKVVAVTWYYDAAAHPGSTGEKGIRLSLADVTGGTVRYRHLLLVLPKMAGGRADFDPIDIHAGGVAWVGDKLWVADTGNGLRMFDLSRIFQVATDADRVGWDGATYQGGLYKYVVPQAGAFVDGSKCNPVFSFVGVDRSTASLVTGEYSATTITGRLLRWPIDLATGALAPTTYADGAWVMGQRQVQGAVTRGGAFYLSSSAPAGGAGVLYATGVGKKTLSYPWVDAPEDLMFDGVGNQLWGASEGLNARYVFAVDAGAVKAP